MDKKLIFATIVSMILAIALVIAIIRPDINIPIPHGDTQRVTTTGIYTAKEEPDFATILIAFESMADTAEEAQQKNSDQMNSILHVLRNRGLTDDDFKTTNYNVMPQYNWINNKREVNGYRATYTLEITVNEYDRVGKYLDAAVSAGATHVYSVRFELDEDHQAELKKEAIKKATQDARDKAEAMAEGLGKRIVNVVSASDSSWNYWPFYAMEGKALSSATIEPYHEPTRIQVSDVEITARINAVFEIA